MPLGAPTFREGLRWGPRSSTRSGRSSTKRARDRPSATRAASRRASAATRTPSGGAHRAIERGRLPPGEQVAIALDPADRPSSTGTAATPRGEGRTLDRAEMIDFWADWAALPDRQIEDGLAEDDWDGWAALTERLGGADPARRRRPVRDQHRAPGAGHRERAANSILVKLNQIGTLTETLEAVEMAQRAGWTAIISHRSGETEDTTIADLAVATNAGQIKTGSIAAPTASRSTTAPAHRGGARRRGRVRRRARFGSPWLTPSTPRSGRGLAEGATTSPSSSASRAALSLTVARWPARIVDDQQPHTEDEVYYVGGRGAAHRDRRRTTPVGTRVGRLRGRGVEHRFIEITRTSRSSSSGRRAAHAPDATKRADRGPVALGRAPRPRGASRRRAAADSRLAASRRPSPCRRRCGTVGGLRRRPWRPWRRRPSCAARSCSPWFVLRRGRRPQRYHRGDGPR